MDTIQCKHCGTENDVGRALCKNCQSPLTAYAGQLQGESYKGKLAESVERMRVRPIGVMAMTVFLSIIVIGWPLRAIVSAFTGRATINADSTNYIAAAFGAVGPILTTIVCLPIAAVLAWIAWSAYTQQVRGWQLSLAALAGFALYVLCRVGEYHGWVFLWEGLAVVIAVLWLHPTTKSWYGIN